MASQHNVPPRGVAPQTTRSSHLPSSAGTPGAVGANNPVPGQARVWSLYSSTCYHLLPRSRGWGCNRLGDAAGLIESGAAMRAAWLAGKELVLVRSAFQHGEWTQLIRSASRPGAPCTPDWADESGVDPELVSMPKREPIANDFSAPCIVHRNINKRTLSATRAAKGGWGAPINLPGADGMPVPPGTVWHRSLGPLGT